MKPEPRSAAEVFGERAAFYTTSAVHKDPRLLARVVELARPEPGWAALDVGTGTGHTAFALAREVSYVVGTDITPEMISEAVALQAKKGLQNVAFSLADAHDLPFADGSFDLVACRRAAHHFTDVRRALAEMARVLTRGGRLVVDDRSVPEDDRLDACLNELDLLHDESHVLEYRPSVWSRMLVEAGFDVDAVEPYVLHRPLSSLTQGVSEANIRRILAVIDALSVQDRQALNVTDVAGKVHINHYYVMVSATKAGGQGAH